MANRADITPELLRQLLRYEPETGKLFWKPRSARHFPNTEPSLLEEKVNSFNSQFAGKQSFFTTEKKGYLSGKVKGVTIKAHRVAWAIHYGEWPKKTIDHINGRKADNRIVNLRDVSNRENARNAAIRKDNKSGVMGVSWYADRQRWRARITIDKRIINLGCYPTIEEAQLARKEAEASLGFHPNHGRAG